MRGYTFSVLLLLGGVFRVGGENKNETIVTHNGMAGCSLIAQGLLNFTKNCVKVSNVSNILYVILKYCPQKMFAKKK